MSDNIKKTCNIDQLNTSALLEECKPIKTYVSSTIETLYSDSAEYGICNNCNSYNKFFLGNLCFMCTID